MINELNKLAHYASKIISNKTYLPILGYVRIGEGKAWVTNLDTVATVSLKTDGNYLVPFKLLAKILKMKPESLRFSNGKENKAFIHYDGKKVSFFTKPFDEFPKFPEDTFTSLGDWMGDIITNLKLQVPYLSRDDLKPSLMGLRILQHNGRLETCATDGHKLCVREHIAADDGEFEGIISPDWLKMLNKKALKMPALVSVGDTNLKVEIDGVTLISRLICEKYPLFRSVLLPKSQFGGSVKVNKAELLEVLKEASGFWNSTMKQGIVTYKSGAASLFVEDVENGTEWEGAINLESFKGEGLKIGYNLEYLMTVIKSLEGETVKIDYPNKAVKTTTFTEKAHGAKVKSILMPVRLHD